MGYSNSYSYLYVEAEIHCLLSELLITPLFLNGNISPTNTHPTPTSLGLHEWLAKCFTTEFILLAHRPASIGSQLDFRVCHTSLSSILENTCELKMVSIKF
jgi:hypothetical protein